MNQNIKHLAEQAGFMEAWFSESGDDCEREIKKFAELIVRECAELTLDYKSETYYNGWLDYRDEIKKHFGLE